VTWLGAQQVLGMACTCRWSWLSDGRRHLYDALVQDLGPDGRGGRWLGNGLVS